MNTHYAANLFNNIEYILFSMNNITFMIAINEILIKMDCMS